jgi:hypothetical protein
VPDFGYDPIPTRSLLFDFLLLENC